MKLSSYLSASVAQHDAGVDGPAQRVAPPLRRSCHRDLQLDHVGVAALRTAADLGQFHFAVDRPPGAQSSERSAG